MSQQLQLRGGPTATLAAFTGAAKEVLVDTQMSRLVVSDGTTVGGFQTAKMAEVGRLSMVVRGVNLAVLGDTAIPIVLPRGYTLFRLIETVVSNASAVPGAARVGVYSAAAQGGLTIAGQQLLTGIVNAGPNLATNAEVLNPSLVAGTTVYNIASIFLNVGTINASALTADFQFLIAPFS